MSAEGHTNPRRIALAALGFAALALAAFLLIAPSPTEVEGGPGFFDADGSRLLHANVWIGLWWAAAANLLLCVLLAASARWWATPAPAGVLVKRGLSPLLVAATLSAGIAGVGMRLPLATKSLWWDEAWTIRQVVVGRYRGAEGTANAEDFHEGSLVRALWYARKPTNHALYSVAAWTTTEAWRALNPGPPHRFSEVAFRTPALLAAMLSIIGIALLCAELGFPHAGPLAAWLFALHPWAIRYGAEGRGYGFVMLFTVVGVWALARFLRGERWRDLLLYAASQVFLLWTWSYAAFVTAGLGASAALFALRSSRDRAERTRLLARLVVAHVLAGMGFVLVFAPNLTMIGTWGVYTGEVFPQLARLGSGLTTGMLFGSAAEAPDLPDLAQRLTTSTWVAAFTLGAIPLALFFGLRAIARHGATSRAIVSGWLAAAVLALLVTHLTGRHFYPRFLIFMLPLVVILAAVALERLMSALARRWPGARGRTAAGAALAATLVAWLGITEPQLAMLLTRPYAPLRDVDQTLRREPDALVAGLGFGAGVMRVYHPTLYYADSTEDIERLCQDAVSQGRPLLVFSGYRVHNSERADAIALLEDETRFEPVADHRGIEPQFQFRVFRKVACSPQ